MLPGGKAPGGGIREMDRGLRIQDTYRQGLKARKARQRNVFTAGKRVNSKAVVMLQTAIHSILINARAPHVGRSRVTDFPRLCSIGLSSLQLFPERVDLKPWKITHA